MKLNPDLMAGLAGLAISFGWVMPAQAQQPAAPPPDNAPFDVEQLFATTCGWCHSDGGRAAGKGPQLMDTKRDDDFIRFAVPEEQPTGNGAYQASIGVSAVKTSDPAILYGNFGYTYSFESSFDDIDNNPDAHGTPAPTAKEAP